MEEQDESLNNGAKNNSDQEKLKSIFRGIFFIALALTTVLWHDKSIVPIPLLWSSWGLNMLARDLQAHKVANITLRLASFLALIAMIVMVWSGEFLNHNAIQLTIGKLAMTAAGVIIMCSILRSRRDTKA